MSIFERGGLFYQEQISFGWDAHRKLSFPPSNTPVKSVKQAREIFNQIEPGGEEYEGRILRLGEIVLAQVVNKRGKVIINFLEEGSTAK